MLAAALLVGGASALATRLRILWSIPVVVLALVVLLGLVDSSPVKPALRVVSAIEPGMSEADVRAVIAKEFPAGGRFRVPEIGSMQAGRIMFCLDLTDGRYDAAVVTVDFVDGKATRASFSAD